MDKIPDENQFDKVLLNQSLSGNKQEENVDNNKQNNYFQWICDDEIPPLKHIDPQNITLTKRNSETTKLQDCQHKLDNTVNTYTAGEKNILVKGCLPCVPPPEEQNYALSLTSDNENKMSSLNVFLKPDLRIAASLRNPSVGTMTMTEEDGQILDLVKSAGLNLEDVKKITDEIKDDYKNKTDKNKIGYINMRKEYLEKIGEALLPSKDANKEELLPFLYYLSLDNHDCMKSLLCQSEMNENVSQLPVSSRDCIFKALKDTMILDNLQKVRKLLRDYILGTTEVYDQPVAEGQRPKVNEMKKNAYQEECSIVKEERCSQQSEILNQTRVKTGAVPKGVQSNAATATNSRFTQSNLPLTNPMSTQFQSLGQSMIVKQMNTTTATIIRPARLNLPMTNPMIGPTYNVRKSLGQSIAVNQINTATSIIIRSAHTNSPMTNSIIVPTNNLGKKLGQSMVVNKTNTATGTIIRSVQPSFLMTNPMIGLTNSVDKKFGPSMVVNQMNTQTVVPNRGYMQNDDTVPRFCVQPSGMYPAQGTEFRQPVGHIRNPNNRRVVSSPNMQSNTSQYGN
ncbi:hypothetical protein EVAR_38102_1 [Eumeta japonica]|uniref:Uncharacterized protein n=1 Tax=Eumeta variegata TaxID=151549 RepID=A0A4C1W7J2_EUMVA|nr:hypothetical protein EVAR_38102_1 [Eumeta japonica]